MDFKDSKVNYDAISQSGGAESAPRILQTGSSCTCCLSHAISSSNIALAGKKLETFLYCRVSTQS